MGGEFVPLACHSVYSLLWGTASVEALCQRAKEAGVSTLALTDRNGLYGVLPFWEAARCTGVEPILGAHLPAPPYPAFLLAENGKSRRQVVYLWNKDDFCALRWRDYKVHFKVFDTVSPRRNIDASVLQNTGTAPWVFNLNVDPKEMSSTGHQYFEWGVPLAVNFMKAHLATMKKYPNTDIGLGF